MPTRSGGFDVFLRDTAQGSAYDFPDDHRTTTALPDGQHRHDHVPELALAELTAFLAL
jgi:hypothetical protein